MKTRSKVSARWLEEADHEFMFELPSEVRVEQWVKAGEPWRCRFERSPVACILHDKRQEQSPKLPSQFYMPAACWAGAELGGIKTSVTGFKLVEESWWAQGKPLNKIKISWLGRAVKKATSATQRENFFFLSGRSAWDLEKDHTSHQVPSRH
jgi:hypothetical protein